MHKISDHLGTPLYANLNVDFRTVTNKWTKRPTDGHHINPENLVQIKTKQDKKAYKSYGSFIDEYTIVTLCIVSTH